MCDIVGSHLRQSVSGIGPPFHRRRVVGRWSGDEYRQVIQENRTAASPRGRNFSESEGGEPGFVGGVEGCFATEPHLLRRVVGLGSKTPLDPPYENPASPHVHPAQGVGQ